MKKFVDVWNNEVKPLAEACIADPEFVRIMQKSDYHFLTKEESEYVTNTAQKYKDTYGMCHISDMIWRVDQAIADGRKLPAILAISKIYEMLCNPSYFVNIFNCDADEEWKKRVTLCKGLHKLLDL